MPSAVKVSGVSKSYGNLIALDDIDFSIEQGSFFGLLGPNGAGKSTLFNSLVDESVQVDKSLFTTLTTTTRLLKIKTGLVSSQS